MEVRFAACGGLAFGQIEVADGDDPVAPGCGQHRVQDLVEALEVEDPERDRHRHGHHAHAGDPRLSPQHANAEFEVDRGDVHRPSRTYATPSDVRARGVGRFMTQSCRPGQSVRSGEEEPVTCDRQARSARSRRAAGELQRQPRAGRRAVAASQLRAARRGRPRSGAVASKPQCSTADRRRSRRRRGRSRDRCQPRLRRCARALGRALRRGW